MNRKFIFITIFILTSIKMNAQFQLGIEHNIDIYLPLTETAHNYNFNSNDFKTNTFSGFLVYSFHLNEKFSFGVGVNYKFINFEVSNIIKEIEYYEYSSSSGNLLSTGFFEANVGYKSISHSYGLNFQFLYSISRKNIFNHQIGVSTMNYILEYNSGFVVGDYSQNAPKDEWYNEYSYRRPSLGIYDYRRGFKLSSLNLSAFYRHVFQLHEKFSLAARVSLGTNLYSDWDQFKKYAWVGLGLEMGFGKVKTWNHSKQKD